MWNIGILDDDQVFAASTKTMIEEYFDLRELELNRIHVFYDGDTLLTSKKKLDILFLDIEVGTENGIEIGKRMRMRYPDMIIIVITSYLKYSIEGYKIQTARYLLKPLKKELLFSELDEVLSVYDRGSYVIASNGSDTYRIKKGDICYIESYGRKVCIHTQEECMVSKESFHEWVSMLDEAMFVECYKGVLVHLPYIKAIQKETIMLEGGKSLPLARRRGEEVKRKWLLYQEKSL